MQQITSVQNPLIKKITSLQTKKGRTELQLFIAEGKRTCTTLLAAGLQPEYFFSSEHMLEIIGGFVPDPQMIRLVSENVMKKISTGKTPSGIVGVFTIPEQKEITLQSGIVLARIADPGNMGTLIRSASAFGLKAVVCVETCDPWSPKVIQATAGTIGFVTVHQISWAELLNSKKDVLLYALVVSGGKEPHELSDKNCLLVIGSEAHGIPNEWLADCEGQITLPMPGKIESLNAAVAGSIAMYQIFFC